MAKIAFPLPDKPVLDLLATLDAARAIVREASGIDSLPTPARHHVKMAEFLTRTERSATVTLRRPK